LLTFLYNLNSILYFSFLFLQLLPKLIILFIYYLYHSPAPSKSLIVILLSVELESTIFVKSVFPLLVPLHVVLPQEVLAGIDHVCDLLDAALLEVVSGGVGGHDLHVLAHVHLGFQFVEQLVLGVDLHQRAVFAQGHAHGEVFDEAVHEAHDHHERNAESALPCVVGDCTDNVLLVSILDSGRPAFRHLVGHLEIGFLNALLQHQKVEGCNGPRKED